MDTDDLVLRQVDEALTPVRAQQIPLVPPSGWIRTIRAALDCELRYVLIPRESLRSRVERRAAEVARARVTGVANSMALEAEEAKT